MAESVENLIIEHLKALRNELRDFRAQHDLDMEDLRQRLSHLERAMAGVKRDQAGQYEDSARQQVVLDQLTKRIERIEKRLELI